MHTTIQLIDLIAKKHSCPSDYRVAQLLTTSPSAIGNYRKGRSVPSPEFATRIANLLEWPVPYVMACAEHERAFREDIPVTADKAAHDEKMRVMLGWEEIAGKFDPLKTAASGRRKTARRAGRAAVALLALGAGFTGLSLPAPSHASAGGYQHSLLCKRRGGGLRGEHFPPRPPRRHRRRRHQHRDQITADFPLAA
jgi:hypothetical protein